LCNLNSNTLSLQLLLFFQLLDYFKILNWRHGEESKLVKLHFLNFNQLTKIVILRILLKVDQSSFAFWMCEPLGLNLQSPIKGHLGFLGRVMDINFWGDFLSKFSKFFFIKDRKTHYLHEIVIFISINMCLLTIVVLLKAQTIVYHTRKKNLK